MRKRGLGIMILVTVICCFSACAAAQETQQGSVPTQTIAPTKEAVLTEAPEVSSPSPEPTATATPTPSPSPEPEATATPSPSPSPEPEATATPTPSPSPEPEATATPSPSPSPEPEATATPSPSPSPEPEATPTPTPSPSPEPTATPTPTPSPSPKPTATPTPSPSPIPTKNPNRKVYEVSAYPGDSASSVQYLLDMNRNGNYDELVVKLPAGNYYFDSTLYVYSNTTIIADKGAKIYKNRVYGAVIEGGITYDKGGYEGCKNVVIDGGLWDAKAIMNQNGGTETFRFIHASGITIKNAEFANVPEGSHFIVLAGVQDALIDNCSFHGYGDDGNSKREPKEAVQLDIAHSVEIVPTDQYISWDDLPCRNVTISNCEFYDYSRAIGSHTTVAGVYHDGIVIKNNEIRDMEEVAIKLYQYKNTTVSGNEITDCAGGVVVYTVLGDSQTDAYFKPLNGKAAAEPKNLNVVIDGNTIKNITVKSDAYGDAIRISATDKLPMSGIAVKNNKIEKTLRYGIFATTTSNLILEKNEIEATDGYGIILEKNSVDAEILGNTITKSGNCGIWIASGSTGTLISGNKISEYALKEETKYGIAIYQAGSKENKTVIEKNEVTNAGSETDQNGIHLNASDYVEIVGNKVHDVAGSGIYVYQSKYCSICSNEVSNTTKNGIYVTTNCDETTIENNKVSGTADVSIMTYQAPGSKINGNEVVTVSELAGIRISQSNDCVITGNTVTGAYNKREVWLTGSENCTSNNNTIK